MKISITYPEILRIKYRPGRDDPGYTGCTWADFDIDAATNTLMITSDCGNYAYCYWDPGPRGMLRFLCGLDEDYLLKKLCGEKTVVDVEATIVGLEMWMEDNDMEGMEIDRAVTDLKKRTGSMDTPMSVDTMDMILVDWNEQNDLMIDDLWEYIEADYTPSEKRIVRIFTEYIQPKIRELVEEGAEE